jgi:hypothetical protein
MTWDESVFAVLEDLEQQAAGLRLAERDAEVAEMSVAEYSRIGLAERVHASLGRELTVRLRGGHAVSGRLARCGPDWLLLVDGPAQRPVQWIVHRQGLSTVSGLAGRADSEETWPVADRLTLRSLLRRLSSEVASCVVHLVDRSELRCRLGRVGHDFVEVHAEDGGRRGPQAVPLDAVAAVREQP